jgi:hypothetical protein
VTYQVVFDVSERLPQLAVGVVAAIVLLVVIAAGLRDAEVVVAWWPLVLGLGAGLLAIEWLLGGLWVYALAVVTVTAVVAALEWATRPRADDDDAYVPPPPRRMQSGAGGMVVGLFALVAAAGIGLPMVGAFELERRLLDGQATIVEGPVMIESRGKTDCLVVDAQRFCYPDAEIIPGFNRHQTIPGGALRTGDRVRLSVVAGEIVRIEVATGT